MWALSTLHAEPAEVGELDVCLYVSRRLIFFRGLDLIREKFGSALFVVGYFSGNNS